MKPMLALICLTALLYGCRGQINGSSPKAADIPFRLIRLPVGTHPTMPAIADVNKDGNLDLIIANGGSGNVSVYLGDGKGGFTQAGGSPFTAGQTPGDLAVADFNGDGNPDIAVAHHGVKLVSILLGNGKGQFMLAAGSPFNVESNPHPHGIAVADFNGDHKPDIAIDSWAENKVLVLFGNGNGTMQTPGTKFDVGRWPYQRLRSADLNADGNADVITSNLTDNSITVLLGDGRGNFTRKDFPVPPKPFGIAIADVNGDQHPDIVIVHYSGQGNDPSKNAMSVMLGDGKGDFTLEKGSPFKTGHYPGTVAAGDLNGDGCADIVIPNYDDGTLTVYVCSKEGISLAPYSPIKVGHTPHGVAIADLNHDGRGDIVVTEEEDNDVLLLLPK